MIAGEPITELYWLAGFIEGEGCFDYYRGTPRISVGNTDYDVMMRAKMLLYKAHMDEGRHTKNKVIYKINLSGTYAAQWMMILYPLMGERRKEKIKECLLEWRKAPLHYNRQNTCKQGHPKTAEYGYTYKRKNGYTQWVCRTCASVRSFNWYMENRGF